MKKSIIIDFDHTIGYFPQIIFLINIIETIYENTIPNSHLHMLFQSFPLIFRPKLLEIIKLILFLQKNDKLLLFILYTCNNKPHFVEMVVSFLKKQLNQDVIFQYILFEKTKHKNMNTLIKEIKEIEAYELCFIDNKTYHYNNNNTKYISCEKYIHHYEIDTILEIFPYTTFEKINKSILISYLEAQNNKSQKKRRYILPYSLYEMNSSFIYQSIHDFVS